MAGKRGSRARRRDAQELSSFVARQQGGGDQSQVAPFDRASGLPGTQLNHPDETAAAGVHRQPIFPQRRGGGPR